MQDLDPSPELAAEIVRGALDLTPRAVRRFATGLQHFVYEVLFDRAAPVVVRISRPGDRAIAQSAARLSRQLRPLGVPLPELIADGVQAPYPYLILERLEGRDLGYVAPALDRSALDAVAAGVHRAQRRVAELSSGGRYGYAAEPDQAPFARWSQVIGRSLDRTRGRIAATGLYDQRAPDRLQALLDRFRGELDDQPATPFLHDTTTKNVIVTPDGRLSGIVDVDDLCYGDPRYAPALTLASFLGGWARGGPVDYVNLWLSHAGWRDDALFRFYVAVCLGDFMGEQGVAFNGDAAFPSETTRTALAAAFDAAVGRIG